MFIATSMPLLSEPFVVMYYRRRHEGVAEWILHCTSPAFAEAATRRQVPFRMTKPPDYVILRESRFLRDKFRDRRIHLLVDVGHSATFASWTTFLTSRRL